MCKVILDSLKIFFPSLKSLDNASTTGIGVDNADFFEVIRLLEKQLSSEGGLSHCQLNQLLHLFHEGGHTKDFYDYYFLKADNDFHFYDVKKVDGFSKTFCSPDRQTIQSLDHLLWGLQRFYIDALFLFGNIKSAYRQLRNKTAQELKDVFDKERFNTEAMKTRGPCFGLEKIEKTERFYLSEILAKTIASQDFLNRTKKLFSRYDSSTNMTFDEFLKTAYKESKDDKTMENTLNMISDIASQDLTRPISDFDAVVNNTKAKIESVKKFGITNNKRYISSVNEMDGKRSIHHTW